MTRARKELLTKTALVWAVFLFLLFGVAGMCRAQQVSPINVGANLKPFNYGYVMDSARVMLEQSWSEWDSTQAERSYCVLGSDVSVDHDSATYSDSWTVTRAVPAAVSHADPYSISYDCPRGTVGTIHIHTPTTCKNVGQSAMTPVWQCHLGGRDSYSCNVDQWDQQEAVRDSLEFSIVQCSKHSFVWYWPNRRS